MSQKPNPTDPVGRFPALTTSRIYGITSKDPLSKMVKVDKLLILAVKDTPRTLQTRVVRSPASTDFMRVSLPEP